MEDPLIPEQLLLDAVNILLESINQPPIADESYFSHVADAKQAKNKILEVKRAVLSEGWDFNQDSNWTFPVDINGFIPVPSNVLDLTGKAGDIINRGWKLYSRSNQSHVFEEDEDCDVIWDMDFNSLTHPIRHYITIRACRIFMARRIGDKETLAYNEVDEEDARLSARRSESRTGRYNMLKSSFGVNNLVRLT